MPPEPPKPPINVDYFEDLTGQIGPGADSMCEQIGDRIKRLREEKGLSVSELSLMTGFEESLLVEIEDNTVCPQLGTLIKLSKALDSALQRLISGEGKKLYSVTRKADRHVVSRSASLSSKRPAYTYMSLAPEVKGRHMEALIVDLEEMPDEERSVHSGEEFIYVLNGQVTLDIADDHYVLDPGDSAYYLSTTPHVVAAQGGKARILAVIYSE